MNISFNRVTTEPLVWITELFSSTDKREYMALVSQYLYKYQIKATLSTISGSGLTSIKVRLTNEEDEAMFILYKSVFMFKRK